MKKHKVRPKLAENENEPIDPANDLDNSIDESPEIEADEAQAPDPIFTNGEPVVIAPKSKGPHYTIKNMPDHNPAHEALFESHDGRVYVGPKDRGEIDDPENPGRNVNRMRTATSPKSKAEEAEKKK